MNYYPEIIIQKKPEFKNNKEIDLERMYGIFHDPLNSKLIEWMKEYTNSSYQKEILKINQSLEQALRDVRKVLQIHQDLEKALQDAMEKYFEEIKKL